MNEYLKSAVKRGERRKTYLINPVSKFDAEIIFELSVALRKLEIDDLKDITEQWKFLKDEVVRDMLLDWNVAHPEGFLQDKKGNTGRKFVEFEGDLVELAAIKTITIDDYYNYDSNLMEYKIILNKNFPDSFTASDMTFPYPTPEARDSRMKSLKRYLKKDIKII